MLKIGILGPFQDKMEVLQVPGERKNSHFSCSANLLQDNVFKVMAVQIAPLIGFKQRNSKVQRRKMFLWKAE